MPECLKVRDMDFHPNLISDQSHVMISFLFYQGARKIVHDLIFCSMLLENEFKRLFALEFTKVITKLNIKKEKTPLTQINMSCIHDFSTLSSYKKTS